MGLENLLRTKGVEVVVRDSNECFGLMNAFTTRSPELWNEDTGLQASRERLRPIDPSAVAYALVPEVGMLPLELARHRDAFRRRHVEDLDSLGAQPVYSALRVDCIPDDDLLESKLGDEPGTVPARSQGRYEDEVRVAGLPAGGPKRVGFAVHRRVPVLDEPVAARTQQRSVLAEDRPSDRNSALGKSYSGLLDGDLEHCARIGGGSHAECSREGWPLGGLARHPLMPAATAR